MWRVFQADEDPALFETCTRFRDRWLRQPIGRRYSPDDFPFEGEAWNVVHLGAAGRIEAMCMLYYQGSEGAVEAKLFQMAVDEAHRGEGLGRQVVDRARKLCREGGVARIYLHARKEAVPFYKACGFAVVGEMFEEIGIPHYRMELALALKGAGS